MLSTSAIDRSWALNQLRLRERRWRAWRWPYAIAGLLGVISGTVAPYRVVHDLGQALPSAPVSGVDVVFASASTVAVVQFHALALLGAFMLCRAVFHWRGVPERVLLIALLEESASQEESAIPNGPPSSVA